jgi:predicted regulator of Ras-like GTPase activity (Roadblock/LC7/MglB family)
MIDRILSDLNKTDGIKGSMVVGKDGLVIASQLPSGVDSELIGAMASAAFGSAERTASEINQGALNQMMIEGAYGKTIMMDAGDGILAVLTDSNVNLGLVRIQIKRSSDKIRSAL